MSFVAGITVILIKMATDYASQPIIIVIMSLPSIIAIPFLMKNPTTRIKTSFNRNLKYIIPTSAFNAATAYLAILALSLASAAKTVTVYQSTAILSVLVGIVLLKESQNIARKIIGAFVTFVGVLLLV